MWSSTRQRGDPCEPVQKKGGHVIRRRGRVVRGLAGWIEDRIGSQVLVEQAIAAEGEEEEDRLDLTLGSGGRGLTSL